MSPINVPAFTYARPGTLKEAGDLLAERRTESRVLAGGTDILVKMKHRKDVPSCLVDLKGVPVESTDPSYIYTARVAIEPPPLVPGDTLENPYLRTMQVVISDRPPESGDPFEINYPTRSHTTLIAKVDK